ncbi:hypothetical protein C2S52_001734 [Perilla frutescens var. hirtella]|nr:hypothetical protein C2S51_006818 [Perilla frutescens var. frutescens]KAH6801270.1 hypothetical protein C2S52_001734 [Perilla frutescens var. hirtella]
MDQVILLYKLGSNLPFNLGACMFEYILKAASKSSFSNHLPFPCLIHAILKHQGMKESKKKLVDEQPAISIIKPKTGDERVIDLPYGSEATLKHSSSDIGTASHQSTQAPDPIDADSPSIPIVMLPMEALLIQIDHIAMAITHLS